jgi:hypothetical protein
MANHRQSEGGGLTRSSKPGSWSRLAESLAAARDGMLRLTITCHDRRVVSRRHHIVTDSPNPGALAGLYAEPIGVPITYESEDWVVSRRTIPCLHASANLPCGNPAVQSSRTSVGASMVGTRWPTFWDVLRYSNRDQRLSRHPRALRNRMNPGSFRWKGCARPVSLLCRDYPSAAADGIGWFARKRSSGS